MALPVSPDRLIVWPPSPVISRRVAPPFVTTLALTPATALIALARSVTLSVPL